MVTITPPVGEIWRIKQFRCYVGGPTGATTGSHNIMICLGNDYTYAILDTTSVYNVNVGVDKNYASLGAQSTKPTTEQAQQNALLNMVASSDSPISIQYTNQTDATQSKTLNISITREVEYSA